MQDIVSKMPVSDIAFKAIISHDKLLIDFLNAYLECNHENKKIIRVVKEIKEKKKDGQFELYAKVIADLATEEQIIFHLYKKGNNLLIANSKKEIEKIN